MNDRTRTTIVTGASRGIGAAIALGLAERGYDVALNDIERQEADLRAVAQKIEGMGRRAPVVFADVSDKAAVDAMAREVQGQLGEVDAVVNNAGVLIAGEVDGLTGRRGTRSWTSMPRAPSWSSRPFCPR